jgi:hypothetical protein
MDVAPVAGASAGGSQPWPLPPRARPAAPSPDTPSRTLKAAAGEPTQPTVPQPRPAPEVEVHVARREDGVQVLTLYDPRTGQVLAQWPPEAVVKVIDAALRLMRRDGDDGGR